MKAERLPPTQMITKLSEKCRDMAPTDVDLWSGLLVGFSPKSSFKIRAPPIMFLTHLVSIAIDTLLKLHLLYLYPLSKQGFPNYGQNLRRNSRDVKYALLGNSAYTYAGTPLMWGSQNYTLCLCWSRHPAEIYLGPHLHNLLISRCSLKINLLYLEFFLFCRYLISF